MTLINDGYLDKILDHADLSACQSLFQQCEVLLRLKSFPVFLHRGVQRFGLPVELCQFGFHLQGGVVFLQVDVQRLRFGYFHLVTKGLKGDGIRMAKSAEMRSGFGVPAVAEFQFRQPLRLVDGDLLAGNEAFVVECH